LAISFSMRAHDLVEALTAREISNFLSPPGRWSKSRTTGSILRNLRSARHGESTVTECLNRIVGTPEVSDEPEGSAGQVQPLGSIARSERIGDDAEMPEDSAGGVLHPPEMIGCPYQPFALRQESGRCTGHVGQWGELGF